MKKLMTSVIVFLALIAIACMANRKVATQRIFINHIPIQIKLDTVKGFENLVSNQFGCGGKYQKLIDSISLNNADSVGFFIRPCFTHRGVFFKIKNSKCHEYYFNFSGSYNQITGIDYARKIESNFFSVIFDSQLMKKKIYTDSVVLIPDCPVVLFIKLNKNFYYRKINGKELEYFSDSSFAFRNLLSEVNK